MPEEIKRLTKEETWQKLVELNLVQGEMPSGQWNLKKAKFSSDDPNNYMTDLKGVDFSCSDLSEANLMLVDLRGANLQRTNLTRTYLSAANLSGADLKGATLIKANLYKTNFKEAILIGAKFEGSSLFENDFSGSNLRYASGLRFNSSFLRGAIFAHNAKDPWSVLRRNYTGTRFLFTLLLMIIFFVPYIARTMMWVGVNQAQSYVLKAQNQLIDRIEKIPFEDDQKKILLKEVTDKASNYALCLSGDCRKWKIWEVLVGRDKGWEYWILAISLLLYNACRFILTRQVGILRDEEDRSGYTPDLGIYKFSIDDVNSNDKEYPSKPQQMMYWLIGYHKLMLLHYAVQVLFWIAVGSFIFHAYGWLTTPVWLPTTLN